MFKLFVFVSIISLGTCMPGGYSEVKDATALAEYKAIFTDVENTGGLKAFQTNDIQEIQKIEMQVVAGRNLRYTLLMTDGRTCTVVIFDQPWTHTREVHDQHCTSKRQMLAGGYYTQTDPESIKNYTIMLAQVQAKEHLSMDQYTIEKIETQVVSGLNIRYTLMINGATCHIVVYDQPWTNTRRISHTDCPKNAKRQLLGGYSKIDVNDPNVQRCISMSLDHINGMSNNMFRLVESNIMTAKKQIVAGTNYQVTFQTQQSRCMNAPQEMGKMAQDCPVDANSVLIPSTWKITCFKELLTDNMSLSDVSMMKENEKPNPDIQLDNDLELSLKPISSVKTSISIPKYNVKGAVRDKIVKGKTSLTAHNYPEVNLLRKKRNSNFLIEKLNYLHSNSKDIDNIIEAGKEFLGGGDDHDVLNHVQDLIGKDGHDMMNHVLSKDGDGVINHVAKIFGGDKHDLIDHPGKLIGGDGHDLVPHSVNTLGGDDHDMKAHGQNMLGGDDHDMKPHGQNMLGGDDHDYCHIGMFLEFKAKFNKLYGSDKEEEKRFMTFCDNMRLVRKLQQTEKGTAIYGATKFADLTKEEFKQYVGKKWDLNANLGMKRAAIPRGRVPDAFDWRDHGVVTPVKNQGSCGSCWAFSTTGNIEGQWAIKKKKLISLSEQELVDCDKVDEGCNGGLPSQAYKEIERLGGLETEKDYAYKGEDEKCMFNKTDVKVYINDSVSISSNETEMASWLVNNGPISIGINAFAMQFYMGGISHPWKIFCNPKELDHGVLIVGYGVQDDKPYWIVKNSWGPDWGEKGYYLVYRGGGVCGLNTMCTSAVVD